MTSPFKILDPREIEATDARAFTFMQEGIRLLESEGNAEAALVNFDRALESRQCLPTETPEYAFGLAACWLNRADALTRLGGAERCALALRAYDEAIALLRSVPLGDDARFPQRLAIALQNRALLLAGQNPPALAEAATALTDAIAVLEQAVAMDTREREYLLAFVWMNLAHIRASEGTAASDLAARDAARQTLTLVAAREREDAASAAAGLKARHVLCHIVTRRLPNAPGEKAKAEDVHDGTDLADEGLSVVRQWEQRGVTPFRPLASDLFRFGALVYARYQPHFLQEFILEQMDPQQSSQTYVESREMQDAARDVARLLPPTSAPL